MAMNFSLEGKTAVLTGASRGLGQGMALALAEAGADVIGVGLSDMGGTAAMVQAAGHAFTPVQADFGNPGEAADAALRILALAGKVDILVNNAGVTPVYPALEYPEVEFDRVMDVNVKSLFLFTQAIGGHMVENRYGRIVNIASVQSFKGGRFVSAYVASKHAVAGLTRAFANEWGEYGVTVNAIAPGYMVTDNTAALRENEEAVKALTAQIPLGRWGVPADLMGPVVFLASDAAAYVNGHLLVVDGGYMNN